MGDSEEETEYEEGDESGRFSRVCARARAADSRRLAAQQRSFVPGARGPAQCAGEMLGEGSFKVVYRGFDHEQGREVAWNVVKLAKGNSQAEKQIEVEIELLQNLHHKNIINFYGHFHGHNGRLVFITEMMTSGTLKECAPCRRPPRLLSGADQGSQR